MRQSRWWYVSGGCALLGAVALARWLGGVGDDALDRFDKTASVVSGYFAALSFVVALVASVAALRQDRVSGPDAERRLAVGLRAQRVREVEHLRLRQPLPLAVRWASTRRSVAAARAVVMDDGSNADWGTAPLTGTADSIVDGFRSLPHHQLVVLGEPGAGKSVLALLLAIGLSDDDPIPLLFSAVAWNPAGERLDRFLVRRLVEELPALDHEDQAARLVAGGRVVPVLDGLDELPAAHQVEAIRQLDALAATRRPLVVTCRGREYERLVARFGVVLSLAAVVEIEPVDVAAAVGFLAHPAPVRVRWQPVLDHITAQPDSVPARVLSSPLMVSLAHQAYADPGTRPAELLESADRAALVARVMSTFLSRAYAGASRRTREHAGRWLGLATRMQDPPWTTPTTLMTRWPRIEEYVILGLPVLLVAVVAGLFPQLLFPFDVARPLGGIGLLVGGWAALVLLGLPLSIWIGGQPVRSPAPRAGSWRRRFAPGFVWGGILGTVAMGETWVVVVAALGCAAVTAFVPLRPRGGGLAYALLMAIRHGLPAGLIVFAVTWSTDPAVLPLSESVYAAGVFALVTALWAGGAVWLRQRVHHVVLALLGWLPWRLGRFLRESQRAGTVRRAGGTWQLRHALVQDQVVRDLNLRVLGKRSDPLSAKRFGEILAANGRIEALRTRTDPVSAERYAAFLAAHDRLDELRERADAGDRSAGARLAAVLLGRGNDAALRARADSGDREAIAVTARKVACDGDLDGAIELLSSTTAPDRSYLTVQRQGEYAVPRAWRHPQDIRHTRWLAVLLERQGKPAEAARRLLATRHTGARADAIELLGRHRMVEDLRQVIMPWTVVTTDDRRGVELLAELGGLEDPRSWFKVRYSGTGPGPYSPNRRHTAVLFADFLAIHRCVDDLTEWADGQKLGRLEADARLARLLAELGDVDRLRGRAMRHNRAAAAALATLLADRGEVDEAIAMAVSAREEGSAVLAALLADNGRVAELRKRAEAYDSDATERLVALVPPAEALDLLRRNTTAGDQRAAVLLAHRLADLGRIDEAIATLDDWANPDDLNAFLATHHRLDDLLTRAEAGDEVACEHLVALWERSDRVDEAAEYLGLRAAAGSPSAPGRLVDLLAAHLHFDALATLVSSGDDHAAHHLLLLARAMDDEPTQRRLARIGVLEARLG